MRANVPVRRPPLITHEGGRAMLETPPLSLRRTLSTCLLFEDTFYEGGNSIAQRLADLAAKVSQEQLIAETLRAKNDLKLRQAPLWMARQLTRLHKGKAVGDTIAAVIQRPDELAEFLALYWMESRTGKESTLKRTPLSAQVKRGLAEAFGKFDAYQLAKWNRDGAVKLRDVLFLVHAKPKDGIAGYTRKERKAVKQAGEARTLAPHEDLYRRLVEGELATPDTWEVGLSAAKGPDEKRAVWTRLLKEGRLGSLALLRNLRNLDEVGVDRQLVFSALEQAKVEKILPFQFVAAWRYAPAFARPVEAAMLRAVKLAERLPGSTRVIVDVSGSMDNKLSEKSDLTRIDAAASLALAFNELGDDVRIWTFSSAVVEIPATRGFALIESIHHSQAHSNTYLGEALKAIEGKINGADRIVVITDEQAHDNLPSTTRAGRLYLINVAPYEHGVDTLGMWTRISGFSTAIVDWIRLEEQERLFQS